MQTSRFLVELLEFKKAVKVLDSIIQEDDSIVESWYLHAYSFCKLNKTQNALECIKNIHALVDKQKITNQEFLEATTELEKEVSKSIKKLDKISQDVQMDNDEGYETYSEEDVSGDEDEQMKGNKQ
jgi:hypothetical protein